MEAILQHQPSSWGPGCPLCGVAGVCPGPCQPSQQLSLLSTHRPSPGHSTASGDAGLQWGSQEAVRQPRWIKAKQIQQPWPNLQIRGRGIHICGWRPGNIALSPLVSIVAKLNINLKSQLSGWASPININIRISKDFWKELGLMALVELKLVNDLILRPLVTSRVFSLEAWRPWWTAPLTLTASTPGASTTSPSTWPSGGGRSWVGSGGRLRTSSG